MLISDNHLFMTAGTDMQSLIAPLRAFNINYFTYNKHYTNGERIRLTTHPHHLKAFLENKYYQIGNIDANPALYQNQAVLLSTLKNQFIVEWLRKNFSVANGVYIIRKEHNFTEYFCFASTPENTNIVNFYLNNLDYLQSFCRQFKEQGKLLVSNAEKNTLNHDYHHRISIPKVMMANAFNNKFPKLTKRENEVAMLLLKAETAKEIAYKLNLNFRTVEGYIQNIRIKFKARNTNELILKLTGN